MRIVKVFWALDASLAYTPPLPGHQLADSLFAVHRLAARWFYERNPGADVHGATARRPCSMLCRKRQSCRRSSSLVGQDALSPADRMTLEAARMHPRGLPAAERLHRPTTPTPLTGKQYCCCHDLVLRTTSEVPRRASARAREHRQSIFSCAARDGHRPREIRRTPQEEYAEGLTTAFSTHDAGRDQMKSSRKGGEERVMTRIQDNQGGRRPSDDRRARGGRHLRRAGRDRAADDGSVRRCKVLEVDGDRAVVQLFEIAAGHQPCANSKVRFLGHPLQLRRVRGHARPCL